MERKKQKLEDREKFISKEQKKCKEELQVAGGGGLYVEANRRLQKAIKDKAMGQRSLLFEAWWRW